jgi:hypothetical protein
MQLRLNFPCSMAISGDELQIVSNDPFTRSRARLRVERCLFEDLL